MSLLDYLKKLEFYNTFDIKNEEELASYYAIRRELDVLAVEFRTYLTKSQYLIPYMQPGRLIKVSY